jgi:hypothetical protein
MTTAIDRNLLLGLLALQNGIINQGQLVHAFQAWTLDKSKSLAEHLEARGDLTVAGRVLLDVLCKKQGHALHNRIGSQSPGRFAAHRVSCPSVRSVSVGALYLSSVLEHDRFISQFEPTPTIRLDRSGAQ